MRLLSLLPLVLVAGCFNPNLDDGVLGCSTAKTCPAGYSCLGDNRCYHSGRNYDLSVGPFYGTGALGDLTLTGSGILLADPTTGQLKFDLGSEVLPAGQPGFTKVDQSNGVSVGIWNFRNITIPRAITVSPSSNSTAILAFAATGTLDLEGSVVVDALGARGGAPGVAGNGVTSGANKQGGNAAAVDASAGGGGGGGNGTNGEKGGGNSGGAGGSIIGTSATPMTFGGGGGGGGSAKQSDGGVGGNGGGGIALLAAHLKIAGAITANGGLGRASPTKPAGIATGGGGGGAGGSILLSSDDITFVGGSSGDGGAGTLMTAVGRAGADGTNSGGTGGAGGLGRISLFGTVTGSASATPQAASNPSPIGNFPE